MNESGAPIQVTGLRIHPVKSTAIRPVDSAQVSRGGFRGDREWMIVNGAGTLVSARQLPRLFTIVAENRATGVDADLLLTAPDMDSLAVGYPEHGCVRVQMFSDPPLTARPAGADADSWLQRAVGREDLHLVWCHDPTARVLDPQHSRAQDYTAFADGFPVTVITEQSVQQVQTWVNDTAVERGESAHPIPAARFRANIEVSGPIAPFAEDSWSRIRIGEVDFRAPSPPARCVMTTIDDQQHKGKEPMRTLAKHRKWKGAIWFAMNLIPDGEGTLHVGDELTVLEHTTPS